MASLLAGAGPFSPMRRFALGDAPRSSSVSPPAGNAARPSSPPARPRTETWPRPRAPHTAELRILRAERERLKAGMVRLRETEAERDRLREALKEAEEKLESTFHESRSSSEPVRETATRGGGPHW